MALAGLGIWQVRPPEAAGPDAPASAFSAARALRDLTIIAAEPHPFASPADLRVRDHLLRALEVAGLDAWVQHEAVVDDGDRHVVAYPQNVLGAAAGPGAAPATSSCSSPTTTASP